MDIGSLLASTQVATGGAAKSATKLAKDFDSFLVLLTTQLQNQDPLDPLKSNEFTQQLVQFTGVEQAIATNKNLESVIGLLANGSTSGLVDFIGKEVTASGDTTALAGGRAAWEYSLDARATETELVITDATGKPVFKTAGETAAGHHAFVWDGRDNVGNPLPDGAYKLSVVGHSGDGGTVTTSTAIQGRVTTVEFAEGQQMLVVGGIRIPLGNVTSVSEPAPENT